MALIDGNARSLCAAALAWMAETKGIQSAEKNGETLTIAYSDGTAQEFTLPNGTNGKDGENGKDGVGTGWNQAGISGDSACLENGVWFYSAQKLSGLSVSDGLNFGDSSVLEFTLEDSSSGCFSAPAAAFHSGDGCEEGVFYPEGGKTYVVNYVKTGGGLWGIVATRS